MIEKSHWKLQIENISASQVSEINKGLDSMVKEFRTRRLEVEYPVIWADALHEKIRGDDHVRSMAVMVTRYKPARNTADTGCRAD